MPFDIPASASCAILYPLRTSALLTVGLPDHTRSPDLNGIATFPRQENRSGWAPPRPRGGGVLPADKKYPAGTRGFSTANPTLPPTATHPREDLSRGITGGSLTFARPIHSLRPSFPRMEQETFGFTPGLRTPPLPATHAGTGTGPWTLAWDHTFELTRPPPGRSTHCLGLRVAPTRWSHARGRNPLRAVPCAWQATSQPQQRQAPLAHRRCPPDPTHSTSYEGNTGRHASLATGFGSGVAGEAG